MDLITLSLKLTFNEPGSIVGMGRDLIFYCPHCWTIVPAGAHNCPACGAIIDDSTADIIDKYIAALRHPQPETRLRAAWVLGRMPATRAVPALLAIVAARGRADRDPYLLSVAVKSLGQIGDQQAVPELAALLADPNASFMARHEAILALARLGGDEAQAALQEALLSPNRSIRERVQKILKQP